MITIYTTPTCGRCSALKVLLTDAGLEYTAKELTIEDMVNMRCLGLDARSMPVVKVNKTYIPPDVLFNHVGGPVDCIRGVLQS